MDKNDVFFNIFVSLWDFMIDEDELFLENSQL